MKLLTIIGHYNSILNTIIWDGAGIFLLLLSGIYLSVYLKFFQIKYIRLWWSSTFLELFKKKSSSIGDGNSITPIQSLCTSLAAVLGVGNIVGVSAAICMGGAGSVFWMWIASLIGMIISYSENVLASYYRHKDIDGRWCGGAMYYIEKGMGSKAMALAFALFTVLASFGIGSMGQVNKIVLNIESAFPIYPLKSIIFYENVSVYSLILGIIIFALAFIVSIGGIKSLARFTEKIVPFMILFFVGGSLVVIIKNYNSIIPSFKAIFTNALSSKSVLGGAGGTALKLGFEHGFKRGVFSNEAGMGSSTIVHAASSVREPCKQGMWGIFEVFVDTVFICTITALVVLCSGVYEPEEGMLLNEATMVADAFGTVFHGFGKRFIAISIFLFAFSSCVGWNYYASKAWEYIFGHKTVGFFKIVHLISMILGAVMTSTLAWDISDTFNGLMMIPNLIAVIFLSPVVKSITNDYLKKRE